MRASIARFTTAVAVVIALGAFGCKSKPKETTQTSDTNSEWKEAPTNRDSGAGGAGRKLDLTTIYFDFDKYDIRANDAKILDTNAAWLKTNDNLVLIEGHCDERGTNEYNLALGERRAKSTMNYLVSQGVQASRITIISYGKERPVCTEHTEDCWARNRRSHFLTKSR